MHAELAASVSKEGKGMMFRTTRARVVRPSSPRFSARSLEYGHLGSHARNNQAATVLWSAMPGPRLCSLPPPGPPLSPAVAIKSKQDWSRPLKAQCSALNPLLESSACAL